MNAAYDNEELPLPLVRRSTGVRASDGFGAEGDIPARKDYRAGRLADRLRPGAAGALMGVLAGAAGLGVVHALHLPRISQGIARLAASTGLPSDAATPMAYLAAGVAGALVGAVFASVTRHLRRFVPLVIWALVFFVSLTTLVLAISSAYGRGLGVSMAPAILAASAAYAFVVSFQLPLRRRG